MPKQRNHQHHRRRGPIHDGLQLPRYGWFYRGPSVQYPEGWETRPPRTFWLLRMYLIVAAIGVGAILLLGLLLTFFGVH